MFEIGKPKPFEIELSHGWGKKGVEVKVKADPIIEDFIQSLGDGSTKTLGSGFLWYPLKDDVLELYTLGNGEMPVPLFDPYQLDQLNKPLILDNGNVNLSILRFKGISVGDGIKFGMKAVHSVPAMSDMEVKIGKACLQLCRDFIIPATVRLVIMRSGDLP